jgi:RNA-directed DNA polymerase
MTPSTKGVDCFGQTLRKLARLNGKPATLQRTPSTVSVQGITTKGKALCKQAVGATPARLIDRLNPVLRGWANYPRHVICAETFAKLDSVVWRRLYRWAKHRHPDKTGRWMTKRYFPHQLGASGRCTDPASGQQIIRGQEAVTPQRSIKIKGNANPFDPPWEASCQHRDRPRARRTTSAFRAQVLNQQQGLCPICRPVIQSEEHLALPHRDGNHQKNRRTNLVFLPPNCHRQVPYAPDSNTATSPPARGVDHA